MEDGYHCAPKVRRSDDNGSTVLAAGTMERARLFAYCVCAFVFVLLSRSHVYRRRSCCAKRMLFYVTRYAYDILLYGCEWSSPRRPFLRGGNSTCHYLYKTRQHRAQRFLDNNIILIIIIDIIVSNVDYYNYLC